MRFLAMAIFAAQALVVSPAAAQAEGSPVVVELYTSQGCSSCPPADEMLQELATHDDVIALALHVDYWDYIGWKDIFAQPAFTARQKDYARAAGARTVYTPQIVIGGRDHVIGAKPMDVMDAIRDHQRAGSAYRVSLSRSGDRVRIEAEGSAPSGTLLIQMVRYIPEQTVAVRRGENAGRTLTYTNIVQSWDLIGEWSNGRRWAADARIDGDLPVVVLVQEPGPGQILAAAALR